MPPLPVSSYRTTRSRKPSRPRGYMVQSKAQYVAALKKSKSRRTKNTTRRAQKGNRSGQDILSVKTLLPNVQKLRITYRDSLNFTNMGSNIGGGAVTPCLMRFLLNDPNYIGAGAGDRIGSVMIQNNTNTPVFVHENPSANLEAKLTDYYAEYNNVIVTKSNIVVNLRFKPNQKGVGQHFQNAGDGSEGDEYRLEVLEPDKVGDGMFWAVSQKNSGTINGQNPSLYQLKREIPGVTMKRMTLSRNGVASKGICFKAQYTPAKSVGIKDWKDNLDDFNFNATQRVSKPRYLYIGATSQQQPLLNSLNLADIYVDYQITYELTLSNRKNMYGNNESVPFAHHTEF